MVGIFSRYAYFTKSEFAGMITVLADTIALMERGGDPGAAILVARRMELYDLERLIERRFLCSSGIKRAFVVENFNSARHIEYVPLGDFFAFD